MRVTWPEIVALVDRHPRIAAGNLQVDAARGGVQAARAVPNPVVEGTIGRGTARIDGASRVEWGLSFTMPLGWIAQRGARVDAAEAEVDVTRAEAKALRRDALLELRTLFWSLAYEQARFIGLEALKAQTAALVGTVKRRVEGGEVRPVEATRVEVELAKVTSEVEAARSALTARSDELALWLGVPPGKNIVAVVDLDALPIALDRDAALSKARANHPAFAIARARTRFLEAELDAEKMARVPAFGITGYTSHELDRRAYGVGLTVDVPLWNWNSGRISQAQARLAASRKQAEAVGLELAASVLDAQAACQASAATAGRFRVDVIPRSEAAASTMERTYQIGEASLLDVIDARRTLLDARRQYLASLSQAQIDCSRLAALVGEEPQ